MSNLRRVEFPVLIERIRLGILFREAKERGDVIPRRTNVTDVRNPACAGREACLREKLV
jgi:hypothetical protein